MKNMIETKNLTKTYKAFTAVDHVSLHIKKCSIYGFLGPNGAGKSTLMKLLSGSELPDRGKIITNKKFSWPLGLSGAFQGSLTARDNAKFVARVYGYKGEELYEKVKFVEDFAELGKFFDEPMNTYSSGMSARIAFGLSMAFDFDYYLIDEAGAVGDPKFREKSHKLYKERLSQSKVIMVSHNVAEIKEWCDKIIFMENGKATVYDDVDEGIAVYQGKK